MALSNCLHLKKLELNCPSLISLNFTGSFKLESLQCDCPNLPILDVSGTAIKSFTWNSDKLQQLSIKDCKELKLIELKCPALISLNLTGCSTFEDIESLSQQCPNSIKIDVSGTAITLLIWNSDKLQQLIVQDCKELKSLELTLQISNIM